MLYTKSIQELPKKTDGVRVCIMRRTRPEFDFDIWLKPLSPPSKLLDDFLHEKITWDKFKRKFFTQVLARQKFYLDLLLKMSIKKNVTLLCWEEKGENCHRILVAERLKELNPKLKIKHV